MKYLNNIVEFKQDFNLAENKDEFVNAILTDIREGHLVPGIDLTQTDPEGTIQASKFLGVLDTQIKECRNPEVLTLGLLGAVLSGIQKGTLDALNGSGKSKEDKEIAFNGIQRNLKMLFSGGTTLERMNTQEFIEQTHSVNHPLCKNMVAAIENCPEWSVTPLLNGCVEQCKSENAFPLKDEDDDPDMDDTEDDSEG